MLEKHAAAMKWRLKDCRQIIFGIAKLTGSVALNIDLDHYDTRILAELQADARLSMAELGRRVHLSQPAVTERVRKLESAGVVTGYRATVNLNKLGYGSRAQIAVWAAENGLASDRLEP